jgi:DNA topoisomerase-1
LESIDRNADHRAAAHSVGLTYVTDGLPGIRRRRVGTGWAYYRPDGTRVADPAERRRLNRLAIPPAWTSVWICPDPDGHLQATARDARGRKQYRYHTAYRAARRVRFRHARVQRGAAPAHMSASSTTCKAAVSRRKILATVAAADKTLIRVSSDSTRANRSFAPTLRERHVEVRGATLRFTFRGKSGVQHSVEVIDRRLARIVQQCQDLPGQELFQYVNGDGRRQAVSSDDVNAYLREATRREVTAKDFRTWAGTMWAARELRALGPADSLRAAERNIVRVIDIVAAKLGNTRSVCRKYYVHPMVLDAYLAGHTAPPPAPLPRAQQRLERPTAALRRDEIAVLQFLQDEEE